MGINEEGGFNDAFARCKERVCISVRNLTFITVKRIKLLVFLELKMEKYRYSNDVIPEDWLAQPSLCKVMRKTKCEEGAMEWLKRVITRMTATGP